MFNNSEAGFSKFPPSSARKLSDIHCTARGTLSTTSKEKEQHFSYMPSVEAWSPKSVRHLKMSAYSLQRICWFTSGVKLWLKQSRDEKKEKCTGQTS